MSRCTPAVTNADKPDRRKFIGPIFIDTLADCVDADDVTPVAGTICSKLAETARGNEYWGNRSRIVDPVRKGEVLPEVSLFLARPTWS